MFYNQDVFWNVKFSYEVKKNWASQTQILQKTQAHEHKLYGSHNVR